MKTFILTIALIITTAIVTAQSLNFGETRLKNLDGFNVSASEVLNPKGHTLIVFWKSGSKNQGEDFANLQNVWSENLKEQGVKMVAICIDGNGSWAHIKPQVNARLWDFEVYVDVNGDLRRAMNVSNTGSIILNGNLEIVYRQNGYCSEACNLINEALALK